MIKAKSKKKLQKAGGFMGNLAQITPYVEPVVLIYMLISVAITGGLVVANQEVFPVTPPVILLIFVCMLLFAIYMTKGQMTHLIIPTVVLFALIGGFIGNNVKIIQSALAYIGPIDMFRSSFMGDPTNDKE